MRNPGTPPSFAALVQSFFAEHLTQQRALSARTVAAYRDAFMLFLEFTQARLHKPPTAMLLTDITPELILAFLDHLEGERHNAVRSRNARLAALRTFLKFAARRDIAAMQVVEQALGVPMKRFERPMLGFLSREEMLAVIGQPGVGWVSQRDCLLLTLMYNTGARVSEIIGLKVSDVVLDAAACVHLHGKGRKERSVPLWRSTVKAIRAWLRLNADLGPMSALLPNRGGQAMTRSNVTQRLALAVKAATSTTPSLAKRSISPHTLRHTTAMHLLQSGVDINVIALWLGHESPTTTHQYVEADLAMKEKALARLQDPETPARRFRAADSLLEFLKTL
ncbi:MAG: tyrosine-type recombinase/integrase [Burkholderiaceae bacterium]|nr:tyrosine-type recombinase/integrase [Burkholderiaceae bacterium]